MARNDYDDRFIDDEARSDRRQSRGPSGRDPLDARAYSRSNYGHGSSHQRDRESISDHLRRKDGASRPPASRNRGAGNRHRQARSAEPYPSDGYKPGEFDLSDPAAREEYARQVAARDAYARRQYRLHHPEDEQGAYGRANYRGRSRRRGPGRRGLIAIICVLVVCAAGIFGFCYTRILGNPLPPFGSGLPSFGALQANDVASEANTTVSGEPAELAWRDADFAVDPSRTDWNYETNGEKIVYLTFDDGPSQNTQKILDILDKYDCKATFFVTNEFPDYTSQIRNAYAKGHTIGLHSYAHKYSVVYSSESAFMDDLDKIGQVVEGQIGYVPCFVRFPGGSSNTISRNYSKGIMSTLSQDLPAKGYQYYDWNADSGDGEGDSTQEIIAKSCSYDNYTNIVLLMHDAAAKTSTVEALPTVIEYYQARGYTFKAIDRSSMVPHHSIGN